MRDAIAELWTWSNWQTNKDVFTLQGRQAGNILFSFLQTGLTIAVRIEGGLQATDGLFPRSSCNGMIS